MDERFEFERVSTSGRARGEGFGTNPSLNEPGWAKLGPRNIVCRRELQSVSNKIGQEMGLAAES